MAGIYVHIPFCRQACHYCNFYFSTSLNSKSELVDSMIKELGLRRDYLQHKQVETIYFGGGTPSLLSIAELDALLNAIHKFYPVNENAEITLEANPDDLTIEMLRDLKKSGINRLSIGIQSFDERDLKYMNRSHTAEQAEDALKNSIAAGFEDISADLIYGIPGQPDGVWKKNLQKIIDMHINHISCYALTVEPKTALDVMIKKGKSPKVEEEKMISDYQVMIDLLEKNDYEHYEISNFAKNKKYARHNTSYWTGAFYSGIGPSAHSFNGTSRQWNISNIASYVKNLHRHDLLFETEMLTPVQQMNEQIMTSLRTQWGLDLGAFEKKFGNDFVVQLSDTAKNHIETQHVRSENGVLFLNEKGKLIADRIISDLFFEEK